MSASKLTDFSLFRRVLGLVKPFWPYFAAIFVLDLLTTPLTLLVPVPLKIAVDSVIGTTPLPSVIAPLVPDFILGSKRNLLILAVVMQILVVLCFQLRDLIDYFLRTKAGEYMTLSFRARLFHQSQRLSLTFHDSRGTTDSIYRIQYDAPSIQWLTIYGFMPLLSSFVMLLSMIYVIVLLNWQLALVALTILPPLFLLARYYNWRMRPRYREMKKLESRSLQVIQEVLTSIRVVKAFGREDDEEERFVNQSSKNVHQKIRLAHAEGGFGLLVNLTTAIGSAAVLFIGVLSVQTGSLTVGELLMVISYLAQLYAPVKNIANKFKSLQSQLASVQRAFELLDERPEVAEKSEARALRRANGAIEFRNVTFAYDSTNAVLKNISLSISPSTRLGIQGSTGAGKSTLVSLLFRLYDPQKGQILLDGVDLRDYKLIDLRNQFAIMLQEPMLFSTSIAENIAYARPGSDFQKIAAAAKAANAHEFISALPEGYDTLVGERGMRLSGGERQRISLARAFLKDAPILILDEPTSSVDIGTEVGIMEAMERLMKNRTTFLIAHRLSTLESCDKLLRIENRQVVSLTFQEKPPARGLVIAKLAPDNTKRQIAQINI
jgi:ATP-binding cassette subfamily B protein